MSLILNGTDGLSDVDGTAGTPAIRGTDANTGIFFPAADTIAFSEGGVESMRIDSSGNVSIGTTSSYSKLNVLGEAVIASSAGTANQIYFYSNGATSTTGSFSVGQGFASSTDSVGFLYNRANAAVVIGTNATERMRIDSAGRTIIGYTASVGTAYQTNMQVKGSSASNYAGYGLITSNNESAGLYGVYSNGENSLWIASDPDNLRSGSRIVFSVDTVDQASIASGGNFAFNSGYGSSAVAYGCRAWVNFNGTGTVAIRGSGNVSSITDNGTGNYTVNFTNAMPDANYAWFTSGGRTANTGNPANLTSAAPTTSALRFNTMDSSFNPVDHDFIAVGIFR
jgi:hypothetical protein